MNEQRQLGRIGWVEYYEAEFSDLWIVLPRLLKWTLLVSDS